MIARAVFALFVLLALFGDARIFLFVMNRVVFGSHLKEHTPWRVLMYVVPPVLLILTALLWPPWLIVAAAVGTYWLFQRIRVHAFGVPQLTGIRSEEPEVIRLRKAHVPFAFLRRLGAHNDVYDIEVTRHEVIIDDLPDAADGYRIAFLTDTHVAPFMRRDFYRQIVQQVERFDPHVVLLGGDFVSFKRHIPLIADVLLADLRARDGVYAVLGNHDYWSGAQEVSAAMNAHGVSFLINEPVQLAVPVIGIDEMYRGAPDVERAFAGVNPSSPCIALSHHPDIIDLLRGHRIDLLLCGHTHGGQIRFPFFGAVVVPSRHEAQYASGFHRVGNVLMYVSRGIGSIPPLRILCRPEVATFILRRGHRSHDQEALPGLADRWGRRARRRRNPCRRKRFAR